MITSKTISEMCHWDVGIYLVGWTSLCKFPDCWYRDVRYKLCKNDVEKQNGNERTYVRRFQFRVVVGL